MRSTLLDLTTRLRGDERGASLVEYGLALIVVVAVSVATFSTMGTQAGAMSTDACNSLYGSATAGC